MSLKQAFRTLKGNENDNEGWECRNNQDGTKTCARIKIQDGKEIADGTVVTIGMTDKCEEVLTGDVNRILDKDVEKINQIVGQMKGSCKRGLS